MPSGRMTRDVKENGPGEGKRGTREEDPEGTMLKVTRKNAVRRATKNSRTLGLTPFHCERLSITRRISSFLTRRNMYAPG